MSRSPSRLTIALSVTLLFSIWALNFIVGKIALRSIPPLTLASFRVVLAAGCMLFLYPLCSRLPAFAEAIRARRESRQGTTLRDLWTFAYLGFFGVAVNQICFTVGLRYTSVSHSSIIVGMGPIYTLVLAVLFRIERATLRKLLGLAIALAGVALLAGASNSVHRSPTLLGDAITMTGSIAFALYAVLGKRVAARFDALTMTRYNFLFGALLILPLAINRAILLGPGANWRAIPLAAWAGLLFMALFSSAIAYIVYYWLLRYLEVTQLNAFTYLMPVAATLLGILFLGERGSLLELLGALLALAGVYVLESARRAAPPSV